MKSRARQRGVGGALLLVVLVLVLAAMLATFVLSRLGESLGDRTGTSDRLAAGADAIDQYATVAQRLPCPADPAQDTGVEVTASPTTCTHTEGTIPWRTIGLRRDDAYDAWGRKISYRVYINNGNGSLTQARGVSMVECDTVEGAPALGPNATCNTNADPYLRNTTPAQFLAGKGLSLNDLGTARNDVAYVLVSHGATGLGAYTADGTRMELPAGDERNNTRATGAFTIKAFSDPDTAATSGQHFDDLLVYRTLPDLVKRASLNARDWPEGAAFNPATMQAAVGSSAFGDTGRTSFSFGGNTFSAQGGGNFTYVDAGGGVQGIGVGSGTSSITVGESVRTDFNVAGTRLAVALANFNWFTLLQKHREQVEVRFYNGATLVGVPVVRQGCRSSGELATYVVDPSVAGATFTRVEVAALEVAPTLWIPFVGNVSSSFLLSEVASCGPTATCQATLATSANACDAPSLTASFSPTTVNVGVASQLTFTVTNGTDQAAHNAMGFVDTLPSGLVIATPNGLTHTCGGAPTITATSGTGTVSVSNLSIASGTASCLVRVNVASSTAKTYRHTAAAFASVRNLVNAVADTELVVQP